MVALQAVKDERLVRLGDLRVCEPSLVREVHLGGHRTRVQAWRLRVQLEVNGLRGLDAHHELVARDILEDTLRHVLELDPDLDLGFVQRCAVVLVSDRC